VTAAPMPISRRTRKSSCRLQHGAPSDWAAILPGGPEVPFGGHSIRGSAIRIEGIASHVHSRGERGHRGGKSEIESRGPSSQKFKLLERIEYQGNRLEGASIPCILGQIDFSDGTRSQYRDHGSTELLRPLTRSPFAHGDHIPGDSRARHTSSRL